MKDKAAGSADQAAIASPRRAPTQQRSRERVERMLAAASALIAAQGSDAMR
ncbi:TetR/AcrR family transcriptional regulator, partial [Mesorhizobium sp. M1E.F.Ca.ET.063.01.1.1]